MAQLTPQEILDISEPIEAIYQRTVDELLINIAHHFNISGWERTRYWEIKKLSEMGALTEESARIIAQNTKLLPEEVEKAFLEVSEKACKDIDPQLKAAAEKGILQDPGTSPTTSILMRENVRSFTAQALDTLNMVNTTMLQSTREAYLRGVTTAVNEAQLHEAKEVLETQAFNVVTGTETRTRAIRKAMNQLTATGITGFYDRAGRKWQAEGYAAMVVRTTAHNAAIEAVKTRQQEFGGGDIFQVSTHPGARPLCYPYQGKFYSWSEPGGEFEDGAGHTHKYENIEQTSYGQPAGLFGINCGHFPIPIVPGYSYPQDKPIESPEENKKEYEESQKQRAYERQVREAKRDLEIAKATGDEEAIKDAKQKVAQEQAKVRDFTKETGRPRRYDREAIAGTKDLEGYKGYRAQFTSDYPQTATKKVDKEPQKQYNEFTKAATIKEAEDYARSLGLKVNYKGIDLEVANEMNAAFDRGLKYCPAISDQLRAVGSGQAINKEFKEVLKKKYVEEMAITLDALGIKGKEVDKYANKWATKTVGRIAKDTYAFARSGAEKDYMQEFNGIFVNDVFGKDLAYFKRSVWEDVTQKYHPVGCNTIKSVFDHEIAHMIDKATGLRKDPEMQKLFNSLTEQEITDGLSIYGSTKIAEFIAEGYAEYLNNPAPREIARKIGSIIEKKVSK